MQLRHLGGGFKYHGCLLVGLILSPPPNSTFSTCHILLRSLLVATNEMLHQLYARKDGYADQDLLPYNPSETAAYAFTALFAIAGVIHLVLMFPYRAWFPIPMIIGTASEYPIDYFMISD